jgi:hypothetical protein
MLFGILQCHSSIPVPPLEPLQRGGRLARLREWIAAMREHFAGYPHLYSGLYLSPERPQPATAGFVQRVFFWLGLLSICIALPFTLPLALFLMTRVPR